MLLGSRSGFRDRYLTGTSPITGSRDWYRFCRGPVLWKWNGAIYRCSAGVNFWDAVLHASAVCQICHACTFIGFRSGSFYLACWPPSRHFPAWKGSLGETGSARCHLQLYRAEYRWPVVVWQVSISNRKKSDFRYISIFIGINDYLSALQRYLLLLLRCLLAGGHGILQLFITNAEQFGTNLRSTVTNTVPNL